MLSRSQFHTNSGVRVTNFKEEPQKINLKENEIQIAFSWTGPRYFDILGGKYGYLALSKLDYQVNNTTGNYNWNSNYTYKMDKCTQDQFLYNVAPNGNVLYCFEKEELMSINELGDPQKLQTMFQVMAIGLTDNLPSNYTEVLGRSDLTMHIRSNFYDITDPKNPVKNYNDVSFNIATSDVGSVLQEILVVKNEYTVNDWYSFFKKSITKSFYNLEQKQILTRANHDIGYAARIVFRGDTKINVYETTILGLLEVVGSIGGFYEVLYITLSIIFKLYVRYIMRPNLINKFKKVGNNNTWFTFPSSIEKTHKKSIKKKRKVENLEEDKNNSIIDRSQHYREDIEMLNLECPDFNLKEIKTRIESHKYFKETLDCINVSQSIHELKLYVSYLISKDQRDSSDDNKNI